MSKSNEDVILRPSHYCGKIETIEYLEDKLGDGFLPYCIGNVMKYISRYDKKGNPVEDLKKAEVYLKWAIKKQEEIINERIRQIPTSSNENI